MLECMITSFSQKLVKKQNKEKQANIFTKIICLEKKRKQKTCW